MDQKKAGTKGEIEQRKIDERGRSKPLNNIAERLGQKARERLRHELEQRPTVRRISAPPEPSNKSKSSQIFAKQLKISAVKERKLARPNTSSTTRTNKKFTRKVENTVENNNVDRWLPDVSRLTSGCTCVNGSETKGNNTSLSKTELPSSIVWLHGLPIIATPGLVRRFFSGLDPQRIMILPPCPVKIKGWDADHSAPHKHGMRVERLPPQHVRVLVKFSSAPTAELAVSRSGEVMTIPLNSKVESSQIEGNNKTESNSSQVECSVGVTLVNKLVATYILRHMAIDAFPGVAFFDASQTMTSNVDETVKTIVWTVARVALNLRIRKEKEYANYPLFFCSEDKATAADYENLVQHRSRLIGEKERIESLCPFILSKVIDPELASDPIVWLTASAVNSVRSEIDFAEDLMLQARMLHYFQSRGES